MPISGGVSGDPGLVLIERQTLGVAAATVTLSSISQAYRSLELRYSAWVTAAHDGVNLRLYAENDTTDANYFSARVFGGTSNGGGVSDSQRYIGNIAGTKTGSTPTTGIVTLHDYAGSNQKTATHLLGYQRTSGQGYQQSWYWTWEDTAAITRLDFDAELSGTTYSFAACSVFDLYGVK